MPQPKFEAENFNILAQGESSSTLFRFKPQPWQLFRVAYFGIHSLMAISFYWFPIMIFDYKNDQLKLYQTLHHR